MAAVIAIGAWLLFVWLTSRVVLWAERSSARMRELRDECDRDFDEYVDEVYGDDNPFCHLEGYEAPDFHAWWREKQAPKLPPADAPETTPYR